MGPNSFVLERIGHSPNKVLSSNYASEKVVNKFFISAHGDMSYDRKKSAIFGGHNSELMNEEFKNHRSFIESSQTTEEQFMSSSSSDEDNLPYPYNALPETRWAELKSHIKKVNELLNEADKDSRSDKPLKSQVPLASKIFAARLL